LYYQLTYNIHIYIYLYYFLKYYNHIQIQTPYPIIQVGSVHIHCIHEKDANTTLEKFKRRVERTKNIIKAKNYNILNILVFTEIITQVDDYQQIIKKINLE